jgi:hypothetical protein
MTSAKLAILTIAFLASASLPATAQGSGGGGGSGSGGTGGGASAGGSSGAGTGGTTRASSTDSSARITNPQTPTEKAVATEQNSAVKGTNTKEASPGSGAVSAPGVGVGHAANGLPIGSPGSGLGSPEQPAGSK